MITNTISTTLSLLPLEKRIKILSTHGKPQQDFLTATISEWKQSEKLKEIQMGQAYYRNKNDIKDNKRYTVGKDGSKVEVTNLSNARLSHPFMRKLVNQKVSYFLSKPFTINSENLEFIKDAQEYFSPHFYRMLKNIGIDSISCGIAWCQVYYDEAGKLGFKRIPSTEVIPFWRDADHTQLDAVIRVYEVDEYDGEIKTPVNKIEFYTEEGVWKYTQKGGSLRADSEGPESHFKLMNGDKSQGANWTNIPFIAFRYNNDEISLLNFVKTLIDDYDKNTSNTSNNLQDTPNSIKVVRDFDGTDPQEFVQNLSVYRTVFVSGEGGVDSLDTPLENETLESHLNRLRKDIFEFGGGIDNQNKELRDTSGVALRFIYADLDMDCSDLINEFSASLDQMMWFIKTDLANNSKNYNEVKYEIVFNTDIIINENDTVNNLTLSKEMLSEETILMNHPYVKDVKAEQARLQKEREKLTQDELDKTDKIAQINSKYKIDKTPSSNQS